MTLSTTDQRYLRTALRTEGRTLLRIDPCTFRIAVQRWTCREVRVRIHDHHTGDFVWSALGEPWRLFSDAANALVAHRQRTEAAAVRDTDVEGAA